MVPDRYYTGIKWNALVVGHVSYVATFLPQSLVFRVAKYVPIVFFHKVVLSTIPFAVEGTSKTPNTAE